MRRIIVVACVSIVSLSLSLSLAACGGSESSNGDVTTSTSSTNGVGATTLVPVPTPDQQVDIDLVVKGWDLCLKKVGDDPSTGQAYKESERRLVKFTGKQTVVFEISGDASASDPVIKAADAGTQRILDEAGIECRYS